jgi:hypothetical protein
MWEGFWDYLIGFIAGVISILSLWWVSKDK